MMTLFAILASAGLILLLGLGDPKRRRAARKGGGHSPTLRRLLTSATLLPGIAFIIYGDTAAFLLWLGGTAVAGWAVSTALPAPESKVR